MANVGVTNQFSPELRISYAWARAIETVEEVGTRAVLIGMIRVEPEESEAERLVAYTGASLEMLYEALRKIEPAAELDLDAPAPVSLIGPVRASPNLAEAQRIATERRRKDTDRTLPLTTRDLFAAMLALPRCGAYRGLEAVVGKRADLTELARYLEDPVHNVGLWMAERFEGSAVGIDPNDPEAGPVDDGPARAGDDQIDATPSAPRGDRVEWLADASAEIDRLGREGLADALVRRLKRMTEATPGESFLLHLDGPWGSGKSSLLNFLRAKLRGEWLVVDFDAWRQSRVGPPWWALLTSLRRTVGTNLTRQGRVRLRAEEAVVRVMRDAGVAPFVLLGTLGAIAYAVLGGASTQARATIGVVAALVASVTVLLRPARSRDRVPDVGLGDGCQALRAVAPRSDGELG